MPTPRSCCPQEADMQSHCWPAQLYLHTASTDFCLGQYSISHTCFLCAEQQASDKVALGIRQKLISRIVYPLCVSLALVCSATRSWLRWCLYTTVRCLDCVITAQCGTGLHVVPCQPAIHDFPNLHHCCVWWMPECRCVDAACMHPPQNACLQLFQVTIDNDLCHRL